MRVVDKDSMGGRKVTSLEANAFFFGLVAGCIDRFN